VAGLEHPLELRRDDHRHPEATTGTPRTLQAAIAWGRRTTTVRTSASSTGRFMDA
jgi:hypothetical protein